MLSSVPGFSSTVWTWAGNDPFRNSTRCLPGLRGIARSGGLTPCLVPSTKTSAQGRATIFSVASRGGGADSRASTLAGPTRGAATGGATETTVLTSPSELRCLHVVVGARHEDLAGFGEAHDALRDVDPVADDVGLAVDVLDEPHRSEVDADANLQLRAAGDVLAGNGIAEAHSSEQGVFGVSEKAHGRAVPGVEDDAVVGGDAGDRLGQNGVEACLQRYLLGDRALRVLDAVEKEHAADECSIGMLRHFCPPHSACRATPHVCGPCSLGVPFYRGSARQAPESC